MQLPRTLPLLEFDTLTLQHDRGGNTSGSHALPGFDPVSWSPSNVIPPILYKIILSIFRGVNV